MHYGILGKHILNVTAIFPLNVVCIHLYGICFYNIVPLKLSIIHGQILGVGYCNVFYAWTCTLYSVSESNSYTMIIVIIMQDTVHVK